LFSRWQAAAALDVWRKARLAMEANRPRAARDAVEIVAPESLPQGGASCSMRPPNSCARRATAPGKVRQELVVLALIKLATSDPDNAAQLDSKWGVHFSPKSATGPGA
jgi:soluble lytic murein transglycosylase